MERARLLLHPAFLGSVVLLALNDHVFKGVGPPALTGKLSDLAGVFALGLLACIVIPRAEVAVALVGALFAALKLLPGVAELAAPMLGGGITLRDPTDLVALIALWPAFTIARRRVGQHHTGPSRRLLMTVSLLGCLLTMTATTCGEDPRYFFRFDSSGEQVFLMTSTTGRVASSSDGGRTWIMTEPFASERPPDRFESVESDEVCTDTGYCFRLGITSVEEKEPGGEWIRSFDITEQERQNARLNEDGLSLPAINLPIFCGGPDDPLFEDIFAAVEVVEVDGVDHAVVAMGRQGALHKEVGGEWERVPVGSDHPSVLTAPAWLTWLKIGFIGSAVASLAMVIAGAIVRKRSGKVMLLAVGALMAFVVGAFGLLLALAKYPMAGAGLWVSLGLLLTVLLILAFGRPGTPDRNGRRPWLKTP